MWILKATFFGIWLFSFGTIALLYFALFRTLPEPGMVGVALIAHLTTHNVYWWIALAVCVAIGLFVTRLWPGKPILWVVLAATEVIPVGLFGLFLMLVAR